MDKLIFRNMFIDGEDFKITDIIWNYFEAVSKRWPRAWSATGTGYHLNRTNGFRGFMRFLRPAYLHFTTNGENVKTEQFAKLFNNISNRIDDEFFTTINIRSGGAGELKIYHMLMEETHIAPQSSLALD
jgi:hypothetical protein